MKSFKIFSIILLLFLIEIIKCQFITITDTILTPPSSENFINKKCPTRSNLKYCDFTFVVNATAASGTNLIISLKPNNNYTYSSSIIFEGTRQDILPTSITKFTINNVPYGNHNIAFDYYVDTELQGSKSFTIVCEEIILSSLKWTVEPIYTSLKTNLNRDFEAIITLNGLTTDLPHLDATISGSTEKVNLIWLGRNRLTNNNTYGFNLNLNQTSMPTNTDILINFFLNSFFLQIFTSWDLPGIWNINLLNSREFPDLLKQPVIEFGYLCSPLFTFISTTPYPKDSSNIYYLDNLQNIQNPMYGSNGSYTYVGYLPDTLSNGISSQTFISHTQTYFTALYTYTTIIVAKKITEIKTEFINIAYGSNYLFFYIANLNKYDNSIYRYQYRNNELELGFPFGFGLCNSSICNLQFSIPQNTYQINENLNFSIKPLRSLNPIEFTVPLSPVQKTSISILFYQIIYLYEFKHLIKLSVAPLIDYIDIDGIKFRNDKITNFTRDSTTFEFIVDILKIPFNTITLVDGFDNSSPYTVGDFTNNGLFINRPPFLDDLYVFSISDVSFLYNNIEMTQNKSFSNVMYFFYPYLYGNNRPFCLQLLDRVSFNTNSSCFYSKWNPTKQLFEIPFIIPANTLNGILPWSLKFGYQSSFNSSLLPSSNQLRITSYFLDAYGPIFSKISKFVKSPPVSSGISQTIGWSFEIQDLINGFKYGDITVRGDLDYSIFNFHITPENLQSGNIYQGTYEISIDLPPKCFSQGYIISEVTLVDTNGNIGRFSGVNQIDPTQNVFINYLDNNVINRIDPVYCLTSLDQTAPDLKSFSLIQNQRLISFTFSAQDLESGLRNDQYPIVYISARQLQTIQCISQIDFINSTFANYSCSIALPNGFGYPYELLVGVYGFINNAGYSMGYPYHSLLSSGFITNNPQSWLDIDSVEIIGSNEILSLNSSGIGLWITGRGFDPSQSLYIDYTGQSSFSEIAFSTLYSSTFKIDFILPINPTFYLKVVNNGQTSNIYKVTTTNYSPLEPTETPSTTPTTTTPVTTSPLPTNGPQKCLNNCGGQDQGYCSPSGFCICFSPYIGNDCSGKIIIVPKPSTNTSNPSTEIPIVDGGSGGGDETDNILFNSLISIVSLRELDINLNVVNTYTFDKWIFNELNSSTNQYQTTINVPPTDTNSNGSTTIITVTLQWYESQSNITFADEQLIMQPSSIKYTISLTRYNFKNQLNSLQLIMSASLSSSKTNDICSNKEFGSTSNDNDNSNYMKIQIDNHSLYGRFIKRALIDNSVRVIQNELLDSSLNAISSASSAQSFIGMTIPFYRRVCTIDPDFSVLINSNSASSSSNSICSSSSNKLSSSQLAGIIIGSVLFAAVIIIAITYYFIKKRNNILFFSNIQNKLKKMG